MELVIVGAGGHASDTLELARRAGWTVEGLLTDDPQLDERFDGRTVRVGATASEVSGRWTLGVGSPMLRSLLAARVVGQSAPPVVDPSAVVGAGVVLERGSAVFWLAGLSPHVVVGAHSFVSYGATVGHDTTIGSFCCVMPHATISGNVAVGDRVLIGAGATVLPGLTIGGDAVIGAGAVVTRDVPPGHTAIGVPARW